jgi:GT2 family glycosyltransferase
VIAVVIVNWNGRPLLDPCLGSVLEQTPPPDSIFLVDNGSTDDSVEYVRAVWPSVSIIEAGSNLGFAGGNNLGIRAALASGADAVLLLNNDAQLLPGALEHLTAALRAGGAPVWAAAPKILYRSTPDVIWAAGGGFDWWRGLAFDRGLNQRDAGQYDRPEQVRSATACCLLVRSDAFRRIGLLDEGYFMYFEDADFAARLGTAGGRIAYEPRARVLHDVFGSSGGAPDRPSRVALYYSTRNRSQFISRHAPDPLRRLLAHAFIISSRSVRLLQALIGGRLGDAAAIGRGLYDAYIRRSRGRTFEPLRETAPHPPNSRSSAGQR